MKKVFLVFTNTLNGLTKLILWFFKSLLIFLSLPIYSTARAVNPKGILMEVGSSNNKLWKIISKRVALLVITFFIIYPVWSTAYVLLQEVVFQKLGFNKDEIFISGTGSMYPTFPKGHGKDLSELSKEVVSSPGMFPYPNGLVFRGKRYLNYELGHGDIVVIEDEKIRKITESVYGKPSGWVKRLIGLPGDSIELRDGLVYVNKEPLKEQYTALPRSTFGESFLEECKEIKVPENSIFVMGDNRKGSGDSREIGFIPINSVNHVLPLTSQVGLLDKNWRDTKEDLSESSKIKLEKSEYLKLLNEKRKEAGVQALVYQTKLERSARRRAETILKYNDFSYEATRSGYTMVDSMREAGYSNIVWGESPRLGYYEASELIENQFEFPESKKFLLQPDFDELGISEVEGNINGCPTQVLVIHFGGYVAPNYKKEDIEGWKGLLSNLKKIQPSWQELKSYPSFYNQHKTEVDRINTILETRIRNVTQIVSTMEVNRWFSTSEKQMIEMEETLSQEQSELANKINSFN